MDIVINILIAVTCLCAGFAVGCLFCIAIR